MNTATTDAAEPGTEQQAEALELERARGRNLAACFTRFLGLAWNRTTSERGLRLAVEDLAGALADVLDLDEDGLTAEEAAAVPSGADELPDEDEPPEPPGL
jgi:hypothetical protein